MTTREFEAELNSCRVGRIGDAETIGRLMGELEALKARLTPESLRSLLVELDNDEHATGSVILYATMLAQRLTDAPAPAAFPCLPLPAELTAELTAIAPGPEPRQQIRLVVLSGVTVFEGVTDAIRPYYDFGEGAGRSRAVTRLVAHDGSWVMARMVCAVEGPCPLPGRPRVVLG